MSGKEEVNYKDRVDIKLYGPDGKLKERRSSEKPSILTVIIALILLIPYLIFKTLVPSKT
jgi:hypothetical protein